MKLEILYRRFASIAHIALMMVHRQRDYFVGDITRHGGEGSIDVILEAHQAHITQCGPEIKQDLIVLRIMGQRSGPASPGKHAKTSKHSSYEYFKQYVCNLVVGRWIFR